jgi:hypothetical protein
MTVFWLPPAGRAARRPRQQVSATAGAPSRRTTNPHAHPPKTPPRARRDYYTANRWPREDLPALEPALKELGQLMVAVGHLLADRCTDYVNDQLTAAGAAAAPPSPPPPAAAQRDAAAGPPPGAAGDQDARHGRCGAGCVDFGAALRESACHRARLLHYFPPGEDDGTAGLDWCSWHFDHGALTGGGAGGGGGEGTPGRRLGRRAPLTEPPLACCPLPPY